MVVLPYSDKVVGDIYRFPNAELPLHCWNEPNFIMMLFFNIQLDLVY